MSIDTSDQYAPFRPKRKPIHRVIHILFIIALIIGAYLAYQHFFANPTNKQNSKISQEENIKGNGTNTSVGNTTDVKTLLISKNPLSRINFQKVGTVTPYKSAILTAEATGVLKNFKVEEGDLVTENDKLVSISDSISTKVAQVNYDNAVKTLENAKKSYKSTSTSVNKDAQIASIGVESAQLNYDNAIKAYGNLQRSLEEQTRSAKIGLQSAQLTLQSSQESYFNSSTTSNINLQNTLSQSLSSITSTLSIIDRAVDATDSLIAMKSTLEGNVKNSNLDNIQDDSDDIFNTYLDLRNRYNNIQGNQNLNGSKNLINNTLILIERTQNMLQDTKDIIDDANSTQTLVSLNQACNVLLASLDQGKNGLHMTNQTLEAMLINSQLQPEGTMTKVEMAQEQVTSTLQQLKQLEEAKNIQLDNAKHAIDMAKKQIESAKTQHLNIIAKGNLQKIGAENQVSTVAGQLKIAKANLGGTILKAPFNGTILEKFLDEGNYVNPSQRILSIGNLDKVYITVSLTADELSFVKLGQEVTISAPGGIKKRGKVTKVLPIIDPISKKINVKILIPNKDKKLLSGMFTDILFNDAKSKSIQVLIPFKSIIFEQDIPYTYIVKNNKAIKTKITLGDTLGNEVEVIDGLSKGDEIIIDGAKILEDGKEVTITNK